MGQYFYSKDLWYLLSKRSNNHDYKAPTKGFAFFWECHLGSEEFSDEI